MMTYSPLFKEDKPHFHTSGGQLAVGLKIYTYAAGTDTPVAMYTDPSGSKVYENPIVLDGRGEPSGQGIYADPSFSYKVVLKTPDGAVVWSMDGVKCAGVAEVQPDVFYATYGETTFGDVKSAFDAGKQVIVRIERITPGPLLTYMVPLVSFDTENFNFFTQINQSSYVSTGLHANEGWSSVIYG